MAMTNEQLTKWIDEIFGTIDEIKTNSGDITLIARTVTQHGRQIQELQADTEGVITTEKSAELAIDDAAAINALDVKTDINIIQSGTGNPSPENVRTISGTSSINIDVSDDITTVNIGVTVYQGNVDITKGTGTSVRGLTTIDTIEAYTGTSGNIAYVTQLISDMESTEDYKDDILSDVLRSITIIEQTIPYGVYRVKNRAIICVPADLAVADFNTNIAGHQLCYPLDSAVSVTFDPTDIALSDGEITVSSSSGDIQITYAPDNVLAEIYGYIQDQVASINTAISALDARVYALEHPTTNSTRKSTKK